MSTVHVVTGAGPVGSTVALQLADAGQQVRLLTRSGSGPEHPLIERRRVDVSRPEALAEAFDGAVAVHHCIHGSAYDARVWRAELPRAEQAVLEAAGRVGAVVVFPESLYSYGPVDGPITEDLPRTATTGKLGVRTELLAQRDASATPTVSVAASDFYGPLVRNAHAGERLVPTVLAGTDDAGAGQPRPAALLHLRPRPGRGDDRRRRPGRSCGTPSCTRPTAPRGHPAPPRRAGRRGRRRARPPHVGDPGARAACGRARLARDARAGRDGLHVQPPLRARLDRQRAAPRRSPRRRWRPAIKETVAWWRAQEGSAR